MADFDPFNLPTRKTGQKTYGKSTKTHDSNKLGRKLWVDLKEDTKKQPKFKVEDDGDESDDVEAFLKVAKERRTSSIKTNGKSQKEEEVENLVGDLSRLDIRPLSPRLEHDEHNDLAGRSSPGHRNLGKSLSKKGLPSYEEEKENIDPIESLMVELALEETGTVADNSIPPTRRSSQASSRRSLESKHTKPRSRRGEIKGEVVSTNDTQTEETEAHKSQSHPKEVQRSVSSSKRVAIAVEIPVRRHSNQSDAPQRRVAPIPVSPLLPGTPDRKGGLRKRDPTPSNSPFTTAPQTPASLFSPARGRPDPSSPFGSKNLPDNVANRQSSRHSSRASFRTAHELPAEEEYEEESEEDTFYTQLEELLTECTQDEIVDFTRYVRGLTRKSRIKKLGEASYSEVFLQSFLNSTKSNVMKVIPFGGAEQCTISHILHEVRITRTMAQFKGYIGFEGAVVTQGQYPQQLLNEWYKYDEEKGSENYSPDFYDDEQLYIVINLENGGQDLEHFDLRNWCEAKEIFSQTANALAVGEREVEFEHRDLHYGNVVIKRKEPPKTNPRHRKFRDDDDPASLIDGLSLSERKDPELSVALIDYTLSRASITDSEGNGPTYHQLDDPCLFTGKGEYQFDIYRLMRQHLYSESYIDTPEEEDWSIYLPKTNVFWLHYILHILLSQKGLPRPSGTSRRAGNSGLSEEEEKAYRDLEKISRAIDPRTRRNAGRRGVEEGDISCAEELVYWANNLGLL